MGWTFLGLVVAAVITAGHSFTTMRYFCTECATGRSDIQVRPFGMRSLGAIRGVERPSRATAIIRWLDPAPCHHRWVFVTGSGGAYA
jgi:hypothetical protein